MTLPNSALTATVCLQYAYSKFAYGGEEDGISAAEIREQFLPLFSIPYIGRILDQLRQQDAHLRQTGENSPYIITDKGIDYVESALVNKDSHIARFAQNQANWIEANLAPVEPTVVPASDRIVTIDHNSEELKNTVAAIEETIDALRGDNEIDPAEKQATEAELKAGLTLLESAQVKLWNLRDSLFGSLGELVTKFKDKTVGAAAKKALDWLVRLIESLNA